MRILLVVLLAAPALAAPTVDPPTVPAEGEQTARLRIPAAGRYAVTVKSASPVVLRADDPMTGQMGQANADGRLDLMLDAGDYRLRVSGSKGAEGQAALTVQPFVESGADDEALEDGATLSGTLADLQIRGAWIQVPERRQELIEATGRALADLRLLKEGQWLVDATPQCKVATVRPGEPRNHCAMWPILEPGWYRVVAYGGADQPWTQAGTEPAALYLRRGLTQLGPAGARQVTVGPFGIERFRVRTGLGRLRWTQADVTPMTLALGAWNPAQPLAVTSGLQRIDAQSRSPQAETLGSADDSVVVVTANPGQVGTLRWLKTGATPRIGEAGAWFATVVQTGGLDDLVLSGHWTQTSAGVDTTGPAALVPLGASGLTGRFNLTGDAEVFLSVDTAGTWTFALDGGRLRVEPLWSQPPLNYAVPPLQPSVSLPLGPGRYRVILSPDQPGQVGLLIQGSGGEAPLERPHLQWNRLEVPERTSLFLALARNPGQESSLVTRKLPADLSVGLPLTLRPREAMVLPIEGVPGLLVATDLLGRRLSLSLGGALWSDAVAAPRGGMLMIRNDADTAAEVDLRSVPLAEAGTGPRLTAAQKAELPRFPVLALGAPGALDLASGATATWQVRVEEAGLYIAESTGLLSTVGTLRTRTRVAVAQDTGGGSGRNFLVARYLKPGDYQLTVGTVGPSAGHLGLGLKRTALVEAGPLLAGRTARLRLPAGVAAAYDFEVTQPDPGLPAARFHIESTGPGRILGCRLEDADGYPVGPPEGGCDRTALLGPGRYRVYLLPQAIETTRLTTLTHTGDAPARVGSGPFELLFDETVTHTWQEPDTGAERAPHVWTFTLAGPTPVSLSLSAAIVGELKGPGAPLRLPSSRTWHGDLAAGHYRLEIQAAHADDGATYALRLEPSLLIAGAQKTAGSYDTVEFSIGESGLYTLETTGSTDVRLSVRDAQGTVLAKADDRPDDWNARLNLHLGPGIYRADVSVVGSYGTSVLSLRQEVPEAAPALAPGEVLERVLPPGGLALPCTGGPILAAQAEAAENVGLALEVRSPNGWRTLAEAQGRTPRVAAWPPEGELRLRVWSLDDAGRPVRLRADRLERTAVPEARLAAGFETPVGKLPYVAVSPEFSAGVALLTDVPEGALVCATVGAGCAPLAPGAVPVGADGWMIVTGPGRLTGQRLRLKDEAVELPLVASTQLNLALPGLGPIWIEANAPVGQPALALAAELPAATGNRRAAALDLSGTSPTVRIWPADGDADVLNTRVAGRRLAALPEVVVGQQWQGELPPGSMQVVRLPGERSVRALLGRGAAALAAEPQRLFWAADATGVYDLPQATGLVLVNPTAAPVPCAVEFGAARAEPDLVNLLKPFEILPARAGLLRLPVGPDAEATLHLLGATGRYHRADGRVVPGAGAPVGGGGVVEIVHGRAPVVVWVQRDASGPWPPLAGTATPVAGAQSIPLVGDTRLEVALGGPGLVSLHGPRGVALQVWPAGGPSRAALDGRLDVWLPEGKAEVAVRGLGGQAPRGLLDVEVLAPVDVTEGVGPATLLGPGDTRLFRFTTTRQAQVGLGVKAEVDRLQATLMDPRGVVVAQGGTLMPDLAAGTWLLSLHLPEDAPATVARPTVLGVDAPPDTPPPEVAQRYRTATPPDEEAEEGETWRAWTWEGDVVEEPEVPEAQDEEEEVHDTEGDAETGEADGDAGAPMDLDTETDGAVDPGDEVPEAPDTTEENE